jgi:tape measure domain-containing protein
MAMNLEAVLKIAAQVTGGTALEKLGASLAGIGEKAGRTISPLGNMRGALRGVADVAATIGLAAVGRELLTAGIEAQAADTRIKALAGGFGEVSGVADVAARAASQFALGNVEAKNAVTDLYGRLRPMGVSLKDVETVFFGVNKAAKQVGLSTYDTSEVLLQLSQALGSGKLQGDELRSIMERMPAVGQAVAKVMGVSASEIKKLGSEGKITTEVMIRAAAELNKIVPPPPTPMQEFEKATKDLRTEIGENLLPILTPFVQGLTGLIKVLASLPEPIQTAIVLIGGLAIAAGPIASVVTGIGQALMILGPLLAGIGPTIAGWAGIIGPTIAAISAAFSGFLAFLTGTILPGLLAFFSGPVGWTVLAIAAVVAMAIAFREPLMNFISWLWEWGKPIREFWIGLWEGLKGAIVAYFQWAMGIYKWAFDALYAIAWQLWVQPWINLWNNLLRMPVTAAWSWLQSIWGQIAGWFTQYVTTPIGDAWNAVTSFLPKAMENVVKFVQGIWTGMIDGIKNAFRGMLQYIANAINTVTGLVNRVISGFNALPGPDIPIIPMVTVPALAAGGVIDHPTLAMVGEGGEREYVIPESKMAAASARYLTGARGAAVVPGGGGGINIGSPQINVTTGPVLQQDGQQYVTVRDLERAMRMTAEGVIGRLRTPAARTALGLG